MQENLNMNTEKTTVKKSIKERLPLINSPRKGVRIVGYWVYLCLALLLIGAMIPNNTHNTSTTAAGEPTKITTTYTTGHGNITANDVASMTGVPIEDIGVTGNDVVVVSPYKENRNLYGAQRDTSDIFQKLFKDSRVQSVEVACLLGTIDVYGNSKLVEGTDYGMSAVVGHKMNWDMFSYKDLYKVCDPAYVNPALTQYELEH